MRDNLTAFVNLPDGTIIMFKGETQIILGEKSDGTLLKWLVEQDNKKILAFGDATVDLQRQLDYLSYFP